ncbi:MAG: DUF6586 family protein [Cellvibrionaceae bacterium]
MINDESYFHLVNRRLAAVKFQLSIANNKEIADTVAKEHACIDSALLQLYFALINYLNELLEHYQRPVICSDNLDLEEILVDTKNQFHQIYEADEIKRCLNAKGSALALLIKLPASLMIKTTIASTKRKDVAVGKNVIAVSSEVPEKNLFSVSVVQEISDHLQKIIDRQRANQSEY